MYFVLQVALNQFNCLIPSVTTVILYLRLYLRCFNIACGLLQFWRKKKYLDVLSTGLKILNPLFKKNRNYICLYLYLNLARSRTINLTYTQQLQKIVCN